MTNSVIYRQICIPAPGEGLTGTVVTEWIRRIVNPFTLRWVALSDVDIAGNVRSQLMVGTREVRIMETTALLSLLERSTQIVWASLFFCSDRSSAESIRADETYAESTSKAALVIRAVDAAYLYIIAPKESLRDWHQHFPSSEVHDVKLDALEFPE